MSYGVFSEGHLTLETFYVTFEACHLENRYCSVSTEIARLSFVGCMWNDHAQDPLQRNDFENEKEIHEDNKHFRVLSNPKEV